MNRKEILGHQVIRMSDEKNIGVLKELILGKKEFKIESLVVYHQEKNIFYKIPFSSIASMNRSTILLSDTTDISVQSKNEALLEIKKCQLVFQDKEVLDEDQNNIGKIVDYCFEDQSGVLKSVIYYHFQDSRKEEITADHIIKNTLNNIVIKKSKTEPKRTPTATIKPQQETPSKSNLKENMKETLELRIKEILKRQEEKHEKEMEQLHRYYQREKEKYVDDIEKEKEMIEKNLQSLKMESARLKKAAQLQEQERQVLDNQKDCLREIETIVTEFKLKVAKQQEKLVALYFQKEKELLEEIEEIKLQLLQKKEDFLASVTRGKEQQMLEDLTKDYEIVLREIKQLQRQFKVREEERFEQLDREYEKIKIREIENQKKEIELSMDSALEDILKEAEQTLHDISHYTNFGTGKEKEMVNETEIYDLERLYEMQRERDQMIQNIKKKL